MISFDDHARHDAVGLAELVRRGEVSPLELVEAAIERIDRVDSTTHAVVRKRYAAAHSEAARLNLGAPLAGVPFLVKDLIATIAGEPTSQGTRLLATKPMPVDSPIVRRQRAAGLLILGQTNTPELGLTPYTEPALFGATRNPGSLAHSPVRRGGAQRPGPAAHRVHRQAAVRPIARTIAPFFERYDVFLTPTLAAPPALIGALQPSAAETRWMRAVNATRAGWLLRAKNVITPLAAKIFDYMPFTPLFNATVQPVMPVPLHWTDDGLPVGMHFAAAFGQDALLLRLAA